MKNLMRIQDIQDHLQREKLRLSTGVKEYILVGGIRIGFVLVATTVLSPNSQSTSNGKKEFAAKSKNSSNILNWRGERNCGENTDYFL